MKRRMLSLFLVLILLCGVACSDESASTSTTKATEKTTAAKETEVPVKESETSSNESESAISNAMVSLPFDVSQEIHFPALTYLGDASLADAGRMDDATGYLFYSNADESSLDIFIALCSYCGLYRYGGLQDDGTIQYAFLRPGSNFICFATLYPTEKELYIQTDLAMVELQEADMEELVDYYLQDMILPSGYGPNVHPEFFASTGRTGADSTGLTDNYFGGDSQQCWREVYANVDYPTLHNYLSDMMLCGFDIWLDTIEFDEDGNIDTAILCLDNDTSKLIIIYYASSGMANLYYQPGIDRYLLKGSEYAMYMPPQ